MGSQGEYSLGAGSGKKRSGTVEARHEKGPDVLSAPHQAIPKYNAEKVSRGESGAVIETYRTNDAEKLLAEIPISTPTLRVKIIHKAHDKFSAEIKGYGRERGFDNNVQRMVEANQREHGQKTLGAPISDGSIGRRMDKVRQLGDAQSGVKAVLGWGRVGKAFLACLNLSDNSLLEATVTTKKSHEIVITVTGFSLPRLHSDDISTSAFAEMIADEIRYMLPPSHYLDQDEFTYYMQKATMLNDIPETFSRLNPLSTFATAADFSDQVTALSPKESSAKTENVVASAETGAHETKSSALPNHLPTVDKHAENEEMFWSSSAGLTNQGPAGAAGSETTKGSQHVSTKLQDTHGRQDDVQATIEAHETIPPILTGAQHTSGKGKARLVEKQAKRALSDADLEDKGDPLGTKHKPAQESKRPRRGIARKSATPSRKVYKKQDLQLWDSGIPSPSKDLPTARKPAKAKKPIPTREEFETAYHAEKLSQYTVPQLRGYLKQENLMGDLSSTAVRDDLLKKATASFLQEEQYPEDILPRRRSSKSNRLPYSRASSGSLRRR